ncbi:SDR family NAD(P)-dependent oxidoreductase [Bradyrhizobium sp. CCBAU 53421]|uniref:SDR family NAD(P)-dependent oxidoreductase n=1 Tax=Bradyrhizobium sp. CCBAU 53421 TaxID=1325120 RepID=UPI001889E8AE|nr:SDR family NAD(P)-dependent oxidoreductase [Bradyrhizobium sp. CCBAU 53421]QOZ38362.1 short-chain dehydrogenase [Bradyrhizobium sp. CCBAU 53421]
MLASHGRIVMVSGASRGIGRAVADRLFNSGFTVSAGMRQPDQCTSKERFMANRYNAIEPGSAEAWVASTVSKFGRIDAVVNAAGISHRVNVSDNEEDLLDEMWQVNVKGPLRVIRAALPYLRACGQGRIVNLGSLSGKRVASNVGYAMSKFAVVALTHGIRREEREAGIRATVVCPGHVATDMTINSTDIPRGEMTQPEDLAELVETVLRLPNNAGVSELLVHCQYEPML